jgi:acyl-CoA dehydrogenase
MRERYPLSAVRGERKCCFARTDSDAGSDPGCRRMTAVRDGNHSAINGMKRFISGADKADFMIVVSATEQFSLSMS